MSPARMAGRRRRFRLPADRRFNRRRPALGHVRPSNWSNVRRGRPRRDETEPTEPDLRDGGTCICCDSRGAASRTTQHLPARPLSRMPRLSQSSSQLAMRDRLVGVDWWGGEEASRASSRPPSRAGLVGSFAILKWRVRDVCGSSLGWMRKQVSRSFASLGVPVSPIESSWLASPPEPSPPVVPPANRVVQT